jgi:DNA-binding Lrp family transcriptional regulator
MKDKYKKYDCIGGIDEIPKLFEDINTSLKDIAKGIGTTSTTVTNDIKSFWGEERLEELKKLRISKRDELRNLAKLKNGQTVKVALEEVFKSASLSSTNQLLLKELLKVFPDTETVKIHKGYVSQLYTSEGKKVYVRYGFPSPKKHEFKMGLHRFKTSQNIFNYDYVVFVLTYESETVIYKFEPGDIGSIKSLNLPFKDKKNCKYTPYRV